MSSCVSMVLDDPVMLVLVLASKVLEYVLEFAILYLQDTCLRVQECNVCC